jgi:hypothetical protein
LAQLNANIPYQKAFVRDAYLKSDFSNRELTECYIFGVKSIINKPLLFHCQLKNGALYWGVPISAFVHNKKFDILSEDENERLSLLQYWDCQSNDIAVTTFSYLQGYSVDCINRNKNWMKGKYLFTIDDYYADANSVPVGYATDFDSKCFHFIELENGNYCAYANNFLRWHNLNFCNPYNKKCPPQYRPLNIDMRAEYVRP